MSEQKYPPFADWQLLLSAWVSENDIRRCSVAEAIREAIYPGRPPYGTVMLRHAADILAGLGAVRVRTNGQRMFVFPKDPGYRIAINRERVVGALD